MFFPLSILGALLLWREKVTTGTIFLSVGGALLLLGVALPPALGPVYKGWMAFARVLGAVNTFVLMSLLFFLVITPLAVVLRLLGRDPLHRKVGQKDSYWVKRKKPLGDATIRHEQQF
jgi:hypothetical protein